ncbi:MAG: hypothetical protein COW55_06155 [Rhodobacteraceae bacterium CG17_big_fil_post_rev_8_21_14_2_50_65_11]|nr:MAG: hypothetical protein COW55_06155 [Rhodobacteraceae bacterium CG17_big_fil_post_rev_8_21_14_2_50_65_11]
MTQTDLTDRLAAATMLDTDLLVEIGAAAARVFPDAPAHPEGIADASEAVVHVISRCLPGWHIHLTGQASEPDAHWRCSLRASEAHDDDDVVGAAHGPTIPLTLARALWDVVKKSG